MYAIILVKQIPIEKVVVMFVLDMFRFFNSVNKSNKMGYIKNYNYIIYVT